MGFSFETQEEEQKKDIQIEALIQCVDLLSKIRIGILNGDFPIDNCKLFKQRKSYWKRFVCLLHKEGNAIKK